MVENRQPGKYNNELIQALQASQAQQGILLILDGQKGPGLSLKINSDLVDNIPTIFRLMADEIELNRQRQAKENLAQD